MDSSDENDEQMEYEELPLEELFEDDENDKDDDGALGKEDVSGDEGKEKKEKVKNTVKRVVKNPRVILNFDRLKGPNGYKSLFETFDKFKFKGKHYEKEDLAGIMQKMQHWMCHHLYPGYDIETCMKALEKLGKKRVIQADMKRMRQEAMSDNWENKENVSENDLDFHKSINEDQFDELLREEF